jgi:acyl-CoA synthetase (AMP-forming)/AMP-acid ligase II
MTAADALLNGEFATLSDLVRGHAVQRPEHIALIDADRVRTYAALDTLVDRAAAAMQRDGLIKGECVGIVAATSIEYLVVMLAALRAGGVAAPLAPSSTAQALAAMVGDAAPRLLFFDAAARESFPDLTPRALPLDGAAFEAWLAPSDAMPAPVALTPDDAFNVIYSSGTTGTPKGIVQSHAMRWQHIRRGRVTGYAADAVTLISTPLYSNTTLVSVVPALAYGGTLVLMAKFDARRFLTLAQAHRVTHAMLVPVQYQRLMDLPDFDAFDLSAFRMKTCTSAPFAAALKADILKRWPGGLVEIYGMTEGGGTMTLAAHLFPDKLHTVGRPVEGHVVKLIDEHGREVPPGELGEVVGHSPAMMTHYLNQPVKTAEAEWFDDAGRRYIRTGDIGRFDADGFLTLVDRRKDMIISGGFNIYPSDLEAVLLLHPAVADAAVVGVPSREWGETPVGFVTLRAAAAPSEIRAFVAERVGKTQRLADVVVLDELPRSAIGKILKRELRDLYAGS